MSATKKMIAARTSLVLSNPFFGSLALRLKLVEDATCQTAWVNGRELGYSPKFIASLSQSQVIGLVAHEVMHCALGHPWRRDARDFKRWNIACDKAINTELRDCGFSIPDCGYFAEGNEVGKSAEWIYGRMGDEQPNDTPGKGNGDGDEGDGNGTPGGNGDDDSNPQGEVRDAPTGPDADGEPAPTEQEWKEYTATAATQAKMMGKLPAGMARMVEQAIKPKMDARSLLLRFFQERAATDYSWTRPNRRYMASGLYMPSLHVPSLGEVAIMVDTSGSIDRVALAKARGQVESVIDECSPARVSLYFADAQVCRVEHFEQGEPLEWGPQGGGGTDFRPALEVIERDETPVCVICITDMYGTFPKVPPSIPVLWLSTSEGIEAPFGETVYTGD